MSAVEITALGVHTYLGGFQHGVEQLAGVRVLGSVESWPVGIRGRAIAKVPGTLSFDDDLPKADLVFANPPCSRFSTTATGHFDADDKGDVSNFDELEQVLSVAYKVGAKVVWWETGPLCWRAGRGMVRSVHDRLAKELWGGATTIVTKYDPRYGGTPQRRPRVHVAHFKGQFSPAGRVPEATWPIDQNIRQWVDCVLAADQVGRTKLLKPDRTYGPPTKTVQTLGLLSSYMASRPRLIYDADQYALTILTGRPFCWADSDAWWHIEEYGAVMTLPLEWPRRIAEERSPREALMLMSKGVAPAAARFVGEHVVMPQFATEGRDGSVDTRYVQWHDGIYDVEMNVADGPRLKDRKDKVPYK